MQLHLSFPLQAVEWENQKSLIVHMSVPKFDISSDMDLISGLKALGVTDVFDPKLSDFTPMATDPEELEEIDFVLDRPFLFVITGVEGLPLFAGVVNQPVESLTY